MNNIRRHIISLALMLFMCVGLTIYASAQKQWTIYNTANSDLTNNWINTIKIDSNGAKWIGTSNGLFKFYNQTWTLYNQQNGLPFGPVSSIDFDGNGNKWIGGAGFAMFDDQTWTVFDSTDSGMPLDLISTIAVDDNDNIWMGTFNSGLVKFDGVNWSVFDTSNSLLPQNFVSTLVVDENGTIVIGTKTTFFVGGIILNYDGSNWSTIYDTTNNPRIGLIYEIIVDGQGSKWIGTYGLLRINGTTSTYFTKSNSGLPDNVYALAKKENGDIWIGTRSGLAKFDGADWTVYNTENSGLPHNLVTAIAIDTNGDKWVGTRYGGLVSFSEFKNLSVEAIHIPPDTSCGSELFPIEVTLANRGSMPLENFVVSARITGDLFDTLITANHSQMLAWEDSSKFTIGTLNTAQGGDIEIEVYTSIIEDIDRNNDTLRTTVHLLPAPAVPVATGDSICTGNTTTLTASNTNHLTRWYDAPDMPYAIDSGSTFTTGILDTTTSFYIINYTKKGCPSLQSGVQVTVNPSLRAIGQGDHFEGIWNGGTLNNPDNLCPGNSIIYTFPPPLGYTNSDYGTQWEVSVTAETTGGTLASGANFTPAAGTDYATLELTAAEHETDSLIIITALYTIIPTQCSGITERYVQVSPLPEASFTTDHHCSNQPVSFNNTSSVPSGQITEHHWQFGDGNTSEFYGPINIYDDPGTYTATLVVTTDKFCTNAATNEITIDESPVPDFQVTPQCAEDTFQFMNLTTYSAGIEKPDYSWDMGDSATSNAFEPEHVYAEDGIYSVTLKAVSPLGCEASITRAVEVYELPEADFAVYNACAGQIIEPWNLSSGNRIQETYWTFGDGHTSEAKYPEHIYKSGGHYQVTLTVTDQNGCTDTYKELVHVRDTPDARFSYIMSDLNVKFFPEIVSYKWYEWDFGDGNLSTDVTPEHQYAAEGEYEVELKVFKDNGCNYEQVQMLSLKQTPVSALLSETKESVEVYPNPAGKFLNIRTESIPQEITLTNLMGQSVSVITPQSNHTRLERNDLPAGSYVLQMHWKDGSIKRLLIMLE